VLLAVEFTQKEVAPMLRFFVDELGELFGLFFLNGRSGW
jgi:hypothetical protein